jgi:DNA end-binding protein Ku
MSKASSSATISFGLMNIPVKLYVAASAERVSFNWISPNGNRLNMQWVDSITRAPVELNECSKGFEVSKDNYVTFTPEEIKAMEEDRTGLLEIQEFAPVNTLDLLQVEKSYFVQPDKNADKPYRLLAAALNKAKRVAIGTFAVRGKLHLVVLRPYEHGIVLHQMYYQNEMRTFEQSCAPVEVTEKSVGLATTLIEQMAVDAFEPEKYYDTFAQRVAESVEAKATGKTITAIPCKAATVTSLDAALEASLAALTAATKPDPSVASVVTPKKKAKKTA